MSVANTVIRVVMIVATDATMGNIDIYTFLHPTLDTHTFWFVVW